MERKIIVKITPEGIKVEGSGYSGASCSKDFDRVLTTLSIPLEHAEKKPEFYLHDQSDTQVTL